MNQKTPQDLDPKLKEAYERVMGGNFTSPLPQTPAPKVETPTQTASPMPAPSPLPNPAFAVNPPLDVMSPSSLPQKGEQATSVKKRSKFAPIIFLLVGLVFFIVYAVVWGKLFKLF